MIVRRTDYTGVPFETLCFLEQIATLLWQSDPRNPTLKFELMVIRDELMDRFANRPDL